MSDTSATSHPLEDIMDEAVSASSGEKTCVDDLLEAFGTRALGPIYVLCGLFILVPPIGMIPGVPTLSGVILFLFSIQFAMGREQIWVPSRVKRLGIGREKLEKAQKRSVNWLERFDSLFKPRLHHLTGHAVERGVAILVCFLALLMPPLELIPGGVMVPGIAVLMFGVGLMAKDGLFVLLALVASAGGLLSIGFALPTLLA